MKEEWEAETLATEDEANVVNRDWWERYHSLECGSTLPCKYPAPQQTLCLEM